MINEAIILAGGLGTRLQGVVSDVPKPMAPVAGKPFLQYLLRYLNNYGIKRVVLAVGYKHEAIESCFGKNFDGIEIAYAIEHEPMGTGGGIVNALKLIHQRDLFLLNGDSYFDVDLPVLYRHHNQTQAQLTLSVKEMFNFERYGTVSLDGSRVAAFNEKKAVRHGYINGGVYALNKSVFEYKPLPPKFSFEKEILEAGVDKLRIESMISPGYFIDIGIPEDYARAQSELTNLNFT